MDNGETAKARCKAVTGRGRDRELPVEIMQLWQDYLSDERVGVRQRSLAALDHFIAALQVIPPDAWYPWARELAMRVVDEQEDIPIRLPLFRSVIFPALRNGLEKAMPACARWLAGFDDLLSRCPLCSEQLPENQRTEYGLLLRALEDDPMDVNAKTSLLTFMRYRFKYRLHGLPIGVLYDHNGANVEQCDEMMEELSQYESLARELESEDEDLELIAQARFHISAYRQYLSQLGRCELPGISDQP